MTRRYPRETILQIYLNELNYGNLAYGIEAAAETYFDKPAKDLTLAQAALLAGLPQAPAYYDPYTKLWEADGRPGAVKRRQGEVLRLMVEARGHHGGAGGRRLGRAAGVEAAQAGVQLAVSALRPVCTQ